MHLGCVFQFVFSMLCEYGLSFVNQFFEFRSVNSRLRNLSVMLKPMLSKASQHNATSDTMLLHLCVLSFLVRDAFLPNYSHLSRIFFFFFCHPPKSHVLYTYIYSVMCVPIAHGLFLFITISFT